MRERPRMRAGGSEKKSPRNVANAGRARVFVRFLDFVFFAERRVATATVHCLRATRLSSDSTGVGGDVTTCNATTRDESGTRKYCRAQRFHSAVAGAPQRPCAAPIDSVLTARTRTGSQSHTTCGGSRHAHPTSCAEGATTHSGASCHTWTWFGRAHVPMCALRVPASCHLCPRRCRPCRRGTWP